MCHCDAALSDLAQLFGLLCTHSSGHCNAHAAHVCSPCGIATLVWMNLGCIILVVCKVRHVLSCLIGRVVSCKWQRTAHRDRDAVLLYAHGHPQPHAAVPRLPSLAFHGLQVQPSSMKAANLHWELCRFAVLPFRQHDSRS